MAEYPSKERAMGQPTTSPTGANNQVEGIEHPGINDVMFGRGGDTNYHIGNHRFRVLADEHREEYRASSRKEKALVVQEVVRVWRARGGRFLTKTDPEKGDDSLWHDVGDFLAKKKAAKILSEKAPREKNKKEDGKNGGGAKRPAADSIESERPAKSPAVIQAPAVATAVSAGGGSQPSPVAAAPLAAVHQVSAPNLVAATASLPASLLQQPTLPSVQAPQQLPTSVSALSTLQQLLQLPAPGRLTPSLALNNLLGIRGSPLGLPVSSLALAAGFPSAESEVSRLALAARVVAQQEQAARANSMLASSLLSDLRLIALVQLLFPGLAGTAAGGLNQETPALAASLRARLTTDELRLLLDAATMREEQKSNDDHSRNGSSSSNAPSG